LPLSHPAVLAVALVAAAALVVSVSFALFDPDIWQHLAVGRAIWTLHEIPRTQIWTWPTYGRPEVTPSWGFRALLWWFWDLGGVTGLFVWRWLTTLLAFGLLWAAARRMGARGLSPFFVLALCGLVYRQRSQVRPETLVAVLMAIQIWLLESRRAARSESDVPRAPVRRGPAVRSGLVPAGLVLVAWAWANAHISYFLGLALMGVHLLDALIAPALGGRRAARAAAGNARRGLAGALAASAAISFVNPFGWQALWQPFAFALVERNEVIFRAIGELRPVNWSVNWQNGLPLVMLGWPILLLWRWRRTGMDLVEIQVCVLFTWLALGAQRFLGYYAIVAAPYLARDLDAWVRTRDWPAWSAAPWRRAAVAALACVLIGLPEWSHRGWPLGVAVQRFRYPERACDFMAEHGVRGRGFNQFFTGGYLLWRFWPDRTRLPFMDIHQSGTPEDRELYPWALAHVPGWQRLDGERHFDYVILRRLPGPGDHLQDILDRDSSWAAVFIDDAGVVYVRRDGPLRAVADSFAYRALPAGQVALAGLGARCEADTAYRRAVRAEAERQVAASSFNGAAHNVLANLALLDGRTAEARYHLEQALKVDPGFPGAHERLGRMALAEGHAREALREFGLEHQAGGGGAELEAACGRAHELLRDDRRAARAYRRALRLDGANSEAQAGLERMERERSR
jgi:hypothetical protein